MRNLGEHYVIADASKELTDVITSEDIFNQLEFDNGTVTDGLKSESRKGKVSWIINDDLKQYFFDSLQEINIAAKWYLNITSISDIQYGIYDVGDYYNWHIDQFTGPNEGDVRKISMTCFLNEDYGGGELDIELNKPDCKDGRYLSFKEKSGSIIFFHSDAWHRVRPVTSGIRKSLVAWFSGPAYV